MRQLDVANGVLRKGCPAHLPGELLGAVRLPRSGQWRTDHARAGLPGSPDGGTAATTILQNLVDVASPEDPQLSIVKAGDPADSYMMHKLDGDFCRLAAACNATGQATFLECGIAMPYGLPSLCLDSQSDCVKNQTLQQQHGERDQIRRWIAQGASAN